MTGWGAQVEKKKIKESGVDLVLAKPMQMRQILSVTEKVMKDARPDR